MRLLMRRWVLYFFLSISTVLQAQSFGDIDITVTVGEVHTIPCHDVTRVAVGNGDIVRVQLLEACEILIIGEQEGTTSLKTWNTTGENQSYRITVHNAASSQDINVRTVVTTQVQILEFSTQYLKRLGINWSNTSAGPSFFMAQDFISSQENTLSQLAPEIVPIGSTGQVPLYFGSRIALQSTLHFLEQTGQAVTLAQPTLSCLSGESAEFLAGGEVPIPITIDGQTSLIFKSYGIKLKVAPKADRHGNISAFIETEVSNVDDAVTVFGAPGFKSRKAKTHMNVESGQTIVIAGLLLKQRQEDIQGIPGTGKTPIISRLSNTVRQSETQTELVIFLTPSVMHPHDLATTQDLKLSQNQASSEQYQRTLDQQLADIGIIINGIQNEQ